MTRSVRHLKPGKRGWEKIAKYFSGWVKKRFVRTIRIAGSRELREKRYLENKKALFSFLGLNQVCKNDWLGAFWFLSPKAAQFSTNNNAKRD